VWGIESKNIDFKGGEEKQELGRNIENEEPFSGGNFFRSVMPSATPPFETTGAVDLKSKKGDCAELGGLE